MTERAAYRIKDFCATYGIGRTKAWAEIKAGRLRAVQVGRRVLIPADAAREWLEKLSHKISHKENADCREQLRHLANNVSRRLVG